MPLPSPYQQLSEIIVPPAIRPFSYTAGGAASMKMMLNSGSSCSFWVAGDSTGNDVNTEWVGLFADYLAATNPTYKVTVKTRAGGVWTDTVKQNPGNGVRRVRWGASSISGLLYFVEDIKFSNYATGDLDISMGIACDDWAGNINSVRFSNGLGGAPPLDFRIISGKLRFRILTDSGTYFADSTVNVPVPSNGSLLWVRVNFDRDNGAGGKTTKFYTSADGVAWTQLGDAVVASGVSALTPLTGSISVSPIANSEFYGVKIRQSEGGPIVNNQALDNLFYGSLSLEAGTSYLGDPEIVIYNNSISGRTMQLLIDSEGDFNAMDPFGTAFVMLSCGHNDSYAGGDSPTDDGPWLENGVRVILNRMQARCPDAVGVVIAQNPKNDPRPSINRRHAMRFARAARWCATNNFAFLNVWQAFFDDGRPLSELIEPLNNLSQPDNVHPTTEGSKVWAGVVIDAYEKGLF